MDELELLKQAWQKQKDPFPALEASDIQRMIHRKSSSVVKWILYISLIEFGLGLVLSLIMSCSDVDTRSTLMLKHWGVYPYYCALVGVVYAITLYFIYQFYQMYRQIHAWQSVQALMQTILNTRKVVKRYIAFNLITFAAVVMGTGSFALREALVKAFHEQGVAQPQWHWGPMLIGMGILLVVAAIMTFLFWLFYKLIYGFLLRKLLRNYESLQQME